ncbi:hypothetical protein RRG08_009129 [Elysia crispata]|uniref:Uncharacterized protein n=1 Tax=Elysia crispata TaxID=231223 RepID=A0AAE0YP81_9GAST|nr:hypothetical protein RRG08_009129 [Elysia crispata]
MYLKVSLFKQHGHLYVIPDHSEKFGVSHTVTSNRHALGPQGRKYSGRTTFELLELTVSIDLRHANCIRAATPNKESRNSHFRVLRLDCSTRLQQNPVV